MYEVWEGLNDDCVFHTCVVPINPFYILYSTAFSAFVNYHIYGFMYFVNIKVRTFHITQCLFLVVHKAEP